MNVKHHLIVFSVVFVAVYYVVIPVSVFIGMKKEPAKTVKQVEHKVDGWGSGSWGTEPNTNSTNGLISTGYVNGAINVDLSELHNSLVKNPLKMVLATAVDMGSTYATYKLAK